MKNIISLIFLIFIVKSGELSGQDYAIGADLSFLKSAEDRGFVFKENDAAKPGLLISKDHGYNWIRLRFLINIQDTNIKERARGRWGERGKGEFI